MLMKPHKDEKRSLTPEKVIDDLDKRGIKVSRKDAEKYLDLLYFLGKLIVDQNFIK